MTLTTTEEKDTVGVLYENGDYNTSCYSRISYETAKVPLKSDDSHACTSLVARLGCGEWTVAELCPRHCAGASTEAPQSTAASDLPLLFMSTSDIHDTWGHQQLVAPPVVDITSAVCNASHPCNLTHPGFMHPAGTKVKRVQGGLLAPNPQRKEAGYEIFYATVVGKTVDHIWFVTTRDFRTYSEPIRVGTLNNMTGGAAKGIKGKYWDIG